MGNCTSCNARYSEEILRKRFFTMEVLKQELRQAVVSPSSEIFSIELNKVLGNLICMSLL